MCGVGQASSVVLVAGAAMAVVSVAALTWSVVGAERDRRETARVNERIAKCEARMAEVLAQAEKDATRIRVAAQKWDRVTDARVSDVRWGDR